MNTRRAIVLILLLAAAPLIAQTIRLGPEHLIPPAVVDSNVSCLIALLPHGDNVVAFWGVSGPLHATLLDPQGNFISDTVVAEVPQAGFNFTWIAKAGDGYLVMDTYDEAPRTGKWRTGAFALDFDFRLRGTTPDLALTGSPTSVACGDSRCAFVVSHWNTATSAPDDRYVMLFRFDGSVAADRLPVPKDVIGDLTPIGEDFLTLYDDTSTHSAVFNTNGVVRSVHDYGNVHEFFRPSLGAATAVPGGAIVVWPQGDTLYAAQLDLNGVVTATNAIAKFSFDDFEEITVSCSNGECTAGLGWYYTSYMVFEGVYAPLEQIHAVRFAIPSLQPIDAKPVTIAIPDKNRSVRSVATPSGTLLAWSGFEGNSVRIAYLGRGATPYAGDPAIDGRPLMNGHPVAGRIVAAGDTVVWTDFAIDGLRNVRRMKVDADGVPASDTAEVLGHDFYSNGFFHGSGTAADDVAIGRVGGSDVVAWNSASDITVVRGSERMTVPGAIATMASDGREAILVTNNYPTNSFSLVRFGETGPPVITDSPVRWPFSGALSNGKLFLQGADEIRLVDLDKQTSVLVEKSVGWASSFVFGARFMTGAFSYRDAAGKLRLGVQRFTLDGHLIDAQPIVIGEGPTMVFAVPLGSRILIVWDTGSSEYVGSASYAVLFDPDTGAATQPLPIKNDMRAIHAVVPRDATHAILVFRTNADTWTVSTQQLEVTSDLHHRAVAR